MGKDIIFSNYMSGTRTGTRTRTRTRTGTKPKKTRKGGYKREKGEVMYTDEDFNSGEGFLTSVWGPAMWHYMHTMSFNYPVHPTEEDKVHYQEFILNLKNVLPCKYCRINLTNNLKQLPLTMAEMENRDTFSLYIYNLHELINKMLRKKSNLTYEDVRQRYEHFRARGCDKTRKRKKELGCTRPLHGKKSKCIIKIVPQETKCNTFQMDHKCIKKQ